jgi:hypothetical protein
MASSPPLSVAMFFAMGAVVLPRVPLSSGTPIGLRKRRSPVSNFLAKGAYP